MQPLIGITGSFSPHIKVAEWSGVDRYEHQYLYHSYVQAVAKAGGIPLIIPVGLESGLSVEMLNRVDGLLLPGGVDIGPSRYNMPPGVGQSVVDDFKDTTELTVVKEAIARKMPLFGICRGIQILAVAFGGKLTQDIKTEIGESVVHAYPENDPGALHEINIEEGSIMHSILGSFRSTVNSWHHQAVLEAPDGWKVTARADDGVIEAIEIEGESPIFAVQWHPEMMIDTDKAQLGLFESFIEGSRRE